MIADLFAVFGLVLGIREILFLIEHNLHVFDADQLVDESVNFVPLLLGVQVEDVGVMGNIQ